MSLDISQGYLSKRCTQKLSSALQPAYAEVGEFTLKLHKNLSIDRFADIIAAYLAT
jgi:hypothetical protein